MPDLLDEIREDLSREKYAMIWQRFGNYFIGAAIAALILTAAGVVGKQYMQSKYSAYSDALFEASNAPHSEALVKYDELMATGNATYKAIAGLRKGALLLETSKDSDALAAYKQVAEESSAPQELRDVAKLLYIAISSNLEIDSKGEKDADAQLYLQDSLSGSGIFKYSAMEISAFKELDSQNYTKAKDIFNSITKSPEAPQNVRKRAQEMLDAIANMNDSGQENATEKKNG